MQEIILSIFQVRPFKLTELASILNKADNYLSRKYIKVLIENEKLEFLYADMINHPNQAYKLKK